MKFKSGVKSWTYKLIIEDGRYEILPKDEPKRVGEIIWSDVSSFTLIEDGSIKTIAQEPNNEKIRPVTAPFIEPNSSYELSYLQKRIIKFTAHPKSAPHIIRGTGILRKLRN